ncbi:hypothetical protein [Corynebacterium pacaense]|uniref:hypothetical protein n=1 Tax=Corynebacterium pacaense TaxID=1816684 RepID=UPI0009BAC422|nr:hypothetical protein [Corynebacterium pacaense]
MPELTPFEQASGPQRWSIAIIGIALLGLVFWLKLPGLIIAVFIALLIAVFLRLRPISPEVVSLTNSIRLSADEISDVQAAYDTFLTGGDADSIADRTLHRPALADQDCDDPDIERFQFDSANATRFLRRLDVRLAAEPSIPQLEDLLRVTDNRAAELRESWLVARKAAYRLGTRYRND